MKQKTSLKQNELSTRSKGRPEKYSTTRIKQVLTDIQSGKSVIKAIKDNDLSYSVFTSYLDKNKDLKRDYYGAREWATEFRINEKDKKFKQYFEKVGISKKLPKWGLLFLVLDTVFWSSLDTCVYV